MIRKAGRRFAGATRAERRGDHAQNKSQRAMISIQNSSRHRS
jgi:hypothetical protein